MKKIITTIIMIMMITSTNHAHATLSSSYISTYGEPTIDIKGNGTIEMAEEDIEQAVIGGSITIQLNPAEGYEVGQFVIVTSKGVVVQTSSKVYENEYYFYQPNDAIFIYVNFVLKGTEASDKWFADVRNWEWYYGHVYSVANSGIMNGYSTYMFAPENNMTRAMMWTILYRYADDSNSTSGESWYIEPQKWVVENGFSDGEKLDEDITVEEIATILYRYAGSPSVGSNYISGYTDGSKVSSWAQDSMNWAVSKGLITGNTKGELKPTEPATRAQVATIFVRFIA